MSQVDETDEISMAIEEANEGKRKTEVQRLRIAQPCGAIIDASWTNKELISYNKERLAECLVTDVRLWSFIDDSSGLHRVQTGDIKAS